MDIYGVIGWPVKHSLSPVMHNAAFKSLNIDAGYLAFEVRPEDLKIVLKGIFKTGVRGLNVTVPHKEKCISFLDSIDNLARSIGAVNTIVVRKSKLIGFNTDAYGFLRALREDLDFRVRGKSIFLLGCGGASRAVSFSLARNGAREIRLTDIFPERARKLASNIKRFSPLCKIKIVSHRKLYNRCDLEGIDLLVNASPVGLKKKDPLLFDRSVFRKGLVVYDLVYNPVRTKLVEAARNNGLNAAGGLSMLLYQGARSFELWTGKRAPLDIMRKALLEAL